MPGAHFIRRQPSIGVAVFLLPLRFELFGTVRKFVLKKKRLDDNIQSYIFNYLVLFWRSGRIFADKTTPYTLYTFVYILYSVFNWHGVVSGALLKYAFWADYLIFNTTKLHFLNCKNTRGRAVINLLPPEIPGQIWKINYPTYK